VGKVKRPEGDQKGGGREEEGRMVAQSGRWNPRGSGTERERRVGGEKEGNSPRGWGKGERGEEKAEDVGLWEGAKEMTGVYEVRGRR